MSDRLLDVACTKCHLHYDAIHVKVASRGSEKPFILFVGEAPGKQEDRKGEAFIGPAGKKLNDLMAESGIDPAWCRWTNIVRCIPKGQHGIGVRPPTPDEVEACRDYLEAEILSSNPVFIVPLGKSAIQFFSPQATSVKGARGKRLIVEFPSVKWRYNKLRKWLSFKGTTSELPVVHTESKMKAQLEKAEKLGFPSIPVKQYTVWPTYHPAAILRGNLEIEQHIIEDLSYLKFQVTGDASVPWDKYKILQSIDTIKATFEHLKHLYMTGQIPHVVSDVETTTLEIYLCPYFELLGFSIAWGPGKSVFIPFNHPESPFFGDAMAHAAIVALTNDLFATVPVVGHNFKYDTHAFWKTGVNPRRVADDTYLGSWTLFNDTCDHGLEALATRFTGMVAHKEEMDLALNALPQWVPLESRYHRMDGKIPRGCIEDEQGRLYRPSNMMDVNLQLVAKYCCADGDSNFRLQAVFEKMLREVGLWEAHQGLPIRAILPTARMERDGIRINLEMFKVATEDFERRLAEKTKWFADHGYLEEALEIVSSWLKKPPKEAKLTSDNVKRAIVYDILRFPVRNTTATGKPSADKDTLGEFLHECLQYKGKKQDEHGFYSHRIDALNTLISFNKDNKLYTSYLKPIPAFADSNALGHCSFGIRTTDTGRFNCREPSWHIIPWHSIIKKAIEPHHEHGLIMISDFAQMELRILAMVTKDPMLLQAFADGKDLHRFTAALCYQRPEDEVTKAQRRNIKAVNFGLVFGRGAPAIAAQLNISIDAAQEIIDLWMRTFPTVARWIEKQHDLVHQTMEVWMASGFRRIFQEGVFNDGELERRAQNTPIQGPASDATAYAMIQMQEMLEKIPSLQSLLWATIHDSLCFSIWPGELLPMAMLARKAMVDIPARDLGWLKVKLQNDYEVGATWGELLEMKLLPQHGHVELDGPTPYFERFAERVMMWDRPPIMLKVEPHIEEDDDGEKVEYTLSHWDLAA